MKNIAYFVFLLLSALFIQQASAAKNGPANCTFSVLNGWTQTITYQCATNINLNGATIQFTVDNPSGLTNLTSVWGFINLPLYPLNPQLSLNGNTVSLPLRFASDPVILSAGTASNFSYSTNNNVKVTGFALYPAGSNQGGGTITFSQASTSDNLPTDTTIHVQGINVNFSTDIVYATQRQINNVPFGTYHISATGIFNNQPAIITASPTQLILDSSHLSLSVALSFIANAASLNISLPTQKPADVNIEFVTAHVLDPANHDLIVNVNWGSQATLNGLNVGTLYKLSAAKINGQQNQYQFNFSPASFVAQKGVNNATIGVLRQPLPTGSANVTVSGLPASTSTTLNFSYQLNQTNQTISFPQVQNGLHTYQLPSGYTYSLSAQAVVDNGFRYNAQPVTFTVETGITKSINVTFTKASVTGVNGWPNYIAMGAVTDDAPGTTTSLQSRPVDAIFKYGGLGGNGDPGQIIYPIFDLQTAEQAKTLTSYYQQHNIANSVKPVMVIYTAQMSGGTNFVDFEYNNLVMHYITLIMESQKLQQYKTQQNPFPGSIILNPDLLGMVQQQRLIPGLNTAISKVSLQNALKVAICFVTHTITTKYGNNLNYESLFAEIRKQSTDNWSAMSIWDSYKMQYFNDCMSTPTVPSNITIPSFTNDFPGWVQSTNWLIRQFAPDVTFGWQINLWGIGSSNWVHQNLSPDTLKAQISDPTVATIAATSAYGSNYKPDFIVFDKYEMDAIPSATGIGYLFNARDWTNVLLYVKNISESLGQTPTMLWQIPGGHLQVNGDIDTRNSNASTEPDFFFADSTNPLVNLKSFISSVPLPASIYGTTSITSYLAMDPTGTSNNYTWQIGHLQDAANSHVFAILWGGGNTTSVGTFPSNDNGWLANKIMNYYKNPTPLFKKRNKV